MLRLFTAAIALLLSTVVGAQAYKGEHDSFSFTPAVAITSGEVDFENANDREYWTSFSAIADFDYIPVELEFRYSLSDSTEDFDGDKFEADWMNWGAGVKLDLSRHCKAACVYLMAGYNYSELDAKVTTTDISGDTVSASETMDMHYPHVGAGFRYQFTNNVRALLEWQQFNIGKQEHKGFELDFGHARVWQAGVAYSF